MAQITKEWRERHHNEIENTRAILAEIVKGLSGKDYHDAMAVFNIFDELHAVIYRIKNPRTWVKTIDTCERMAGLIISKELKEVTKQRIKRYAL